MSNLILFILLASFTFNLNAEEDKATDDYNKWQARFRLISVIPSPGDDVEWVNVDISTAFVPELYFIYFFNKNVALEFILATTKHEVEVGKTDLGHGWLLPPTLNLQYHFYADSFRPYVGAGVN